MKIWGIIYKIMITKINALFVLLKNLKYLKFNNIKDDLINLYKYKLGIFKDILSEGITPSVILKDILGIF